MVDSAPTEVATDTADLAEEMAEVAPVDYAPAVPTVTEELAVPTVTEELVVPIATEELVVPIAIEELIVPIVVAELIVPIVVADRAAPKAGSDTFDGVVVVATVVRYSDHSSPLGRQEQKEHCCWRKIGT